MKIILNRNYGLISLCNKRIPLGKEKVLSPSPTLAAYLTLYTNSACCLHEYIKYETKREGTLSEVKDSSHCLIACILAMEITLNA